MRVVLDTNVLVRTGDKPDLLALGAYAGTKIVSVRDFLTLARSLP